MSLKLSLHLPVPVCKVLSPKHFVSAHQKTLKVASAAAQSHICSMKTENAEFHGLNYTVKAAR